MPTPRLKPYEVTERVFLVGAGVWNDCIGVTEGGSSTTYLIDGGGELALVDCGYRYAVNQLFENVRTLGFDPKKISTVLLTHAHYDHTDGLPELAAALPQAQIHAHPITIETLATNGGIYVPEFKPGDFRPFHVKHVLKEGDTVRVGTRVLRVIETPGHTPDGLCFMMKTDSGLVCLSGDTAIGDQNCAKGVVGWIEAHWGSRLSHFQTSLQRLNAEPIVALLGGHGTASVGREKAATSLKNCLWRVEQLMAIPGLETMMPVRI
ncbi:MAG TPA: MBL fold metallo-hydrolase [Planctomycetota bacterium]|nr:MBL fold metallo-hydrolase [Planctomycetota bacterium]